MSQQLLLILSFVSGFSYIHFLQSYDVHEKEPFGRMALITIVGGVISFCLAVFLYIFLESFGINEIESGFGALAVIGPVEEFSKLVAMLLCLIFIRKRMNEPTDGMIYMACVALGFSLIENYFYIAESNQPYVTMGIRLLLSTPMHISFSLFMGMAVYSLIKNRQGWGLLAIAFLYAVLTHGLYDLIIFEDLSSVVFFFLIYMSHAWSFSLAGYCAAVSPHRITFKDFVEGYENPVEEEGLECVNCGDKSNKLTYVADGIRVQKCPSCEFYLTGKKSLFNIFRRFGSTFRKLHKYYWPAENSKAAFSVLYDANYVSDEKKIAYFDLEKLNDVLEKFTFDRIEAAPRIVRAALRPPEFSFHAMEKSVARRWKDVQDFNVFPHGDSEAFGFDVDEVDERLDTDKFDDRIMLGDTPFSDEPLKREPQPREKLSWKDSFFRFLIYPLEGGNTPKVVHSPKERGPLICWGGLFMPEFWFLWNEIWGASFLVWLAEVLIIYSATRWLGFMDSLQVALITVRFAGALLGHHIYYYRNGRWCGRSS
ncbi:protease PrsW [Marinifilum sp. JC120]|nr:protease PrsW [Marinifilum sp. JC120]